MIVTIITSAGTITIATLPITTIRFPFCALVACAIIVV